MLHCLKALEESSFSAEQAYFFVMDETGHVMYHPDISQIGKYAGTEKPELQKFIAESSVLSGEKLVYYTQKPARKPVWTIISVVDCAPFTAAIDQRLFISLLIATLSFSDCTCRCNYSHIAADTVC